MLELKLMKWCDHWIGIVICCALGIYNQIISLFISRKSELPENPKTILICKFFGLGSIILSTPLLQEIKRKYPDTKLVFLTFSGNRTLLTFLDICDEIITIRNDNVLHFLSDTFTRLRMVYQLHPAITIDLEFYSKYTTIFTFFSRARVRVGFYLHSFWRTALYTHEVYFNYRKHILEIYRMVGSSIGLDIKKYYPKKIPISRELERKVHSYLLQHISDNGRKLVGINVNASDLAYCRRWPLQHFADLIEELVMEHECHVFLTGSSSEKEYTESCLALISNEETRKYTKNIAGELSLEEFLALLNVLTVFITNDSGPVHLASTQEVATVSIWGPGSPSFYGMESPLQQHIYLNYDCSPCMYIYRTDAGRFCDRKAPCLRELAPNRVMATILPFLEN